MTQNPPVTGVVLDASAVLALFFLEPGAEVVERNLADSAISAVNYTEVITKQIRRGADPRRIVESMSALELNIVPWDADLANAAADLSPLAWTHGLALGDRACLATARHLKLPVLTAERSWTDLPSLGIEVRLIR